MARNERIDTGWQFTEMPLGTTPQGARASVSWRAVDVPHDWLISDPRDLYRSGEGWYRRALTVNAAPGERALLRFEGVYQDSSLFINGAFAGEWKYGYTTHEFDITEFLKPGENECLLRCVYESPNTRWYSGAGIYRHVHLKVVPPCRFVSDGIYITALPQGPGMRVEVDSEIIVPEGKTALLRHEVLSPDGETVAVVEGTVTAAGTDTRVLETETARRWETDDPALYTLRSTLTCGGDIHREEQRFGLRTTAFDPEKGFLLNGKPVKLHGVCLHHDLGALGAAVNRAATRRQLNILRGIGVNAIRTSHNPPSVEMMELCDEMGLLVLSEAFDMWEMHKTEHDYASFFPEWAERDVAAWVRRDRNRPSVILWSIGNEIYDTHAGPRGQEVTRMLMGFVRKNDPKGHAPCTIGSNYMPWENAQKCADILKIAGYNYAERCYQEHHRAHPDWVIYGSETFSMVQSRGIYHFPLEADVLTDDDLQCSALGNSNTSWGAESYEKCITDDRDAPFCMGQFVWSGFDYIGEPTPYHTKNSYFGLIDTAGFLKDAAYVFKAEWTDGKARPFVHVFPYWDFNEGQLIDVQVCSNAPRIRLLLNGRLIGEKEIDHKNGLSLIGKWKVPYEKGVLRAEALDESGAVVAAEEKRSFGDARRITLSCERTTLLADGEDMAFVEIGMLDGQGIPVENANNRVRVQVRGAGRLVGLDNGDSTDYDSWQGDRRRLFSGKLLAMIASDGTSGPVTVTVTSPGMEAAEMTLAALPAPMKESVCCSRRNAECPENNEVPIRKLTLSCGPVLLTRERPAISVRAVISPANATYRDLTWRVTTKNGIDSAAAKIEGSGGEVTLRALGDGEFLLRCMAKNGAMHPRIISAIECRAEGIGPALLDPYGFVAGGLYTLSHGCIGAANERGFATQRDGDSAVGFEHLDFGPVGSDEITLPIFTLNDDAYRFELFAGDPDEGGEMVLAGVYRKKSIWNTYQSETYRLTRRLRGECTLWFRGHEKMHVKGFSFKEYPRAWETLRALDCDSLYGDAYEKTTDAIESIGNNVTLVFRRMDFGGIPVKLTLCGRTALPQNTVQVRFRGANEEKTVLCEFEHAEDYIEQTFPVGRVPEKCEVQFVFLPGSRFDFQYFRFERDE